MNEDRLDDLEDLADVLAEYATCGMILLYILLVVGGALLTAVLGFLPLGG